MSDSDEDTAMWPSSPYALVDTRLCPSCFATSDRHHLRALRPRARGSPGARSSRARAQHAGARGQATAAHRGDPARAQHRAGRRAPEPSTPTATAVPRSAGVVRRRPRAGSRHGRSLPDPALESIAAAPHARTGGGSPPWSLEPAAAPPQSPPPPTADRRRPRHPSVSDASAAPAHRPGAAAHRRRLARRRRGDLLPRARLEHRRHPDAGAHHRRRHARDDGRRLAAASLVADGDRRGDRRARRDPARPRRLGGAARTTCSAPAAWIRSSTRASRRSPSASSCRVWAVISRLRGPDLAATLALPTGLGLLVGGSRAPRRRPARSPPDSSAPRSADSPTRCPRRGRPPDPAPTPCRSAPPSRSSAWRRSSAAPPTTLLLGLESMAVQLVAAGVVIVVGARTPLCCDRGRTLSRFPWRRSWDMPRGHSRQRSWGR